METHAGLRPCHDDHGTAGHRCAGRPADRPDALPRLHGRPTWSTTSAGCPWRSRCAAARSVPPGDGARRGRLSPRGRLARADRRPARRAGGRPGGTRRRTTASPGRTDRDAGATRPHSSPSTRSSCMAGTWRAPPAGSFDVDDAAAVAACLAFVAVLRAAAEARRRWRSLRSSGPGPRPTLDVLDRLIGATGRDPLRPGPRDRFRPAPPSPVPFPAVACPSGLRRTPRKRLWVQAHRGFKSLRHRHAKQPLTCANTDQGLLLACSVPAACQMRSGTTRSSVPPSAPRRRALQSDSVQWTSDVGGAQCPAGMSQPMGEPPAAPGHPVDVSVVPGRRAPAVAAFPVRRASAIDHKGTSIGMGDADSGHVRAVARPLWARHRAPPPAPPPPDS